MFQVQLAPGVQQDVRGFQMNSRAELYSSEQQR